MRVLWAVSLFMLVWFVGSAPPVFGSSSPILPGVLLTLISLWLLFFLSSCQRRTAVYVRLRLVALNRLFFIKGFRI